MSWVTLGTRSTLPNRSKTHTHVVGFPWFHLLSPIPTHKYPYPCYYYECPSDNTIFVSVMLGLVAYVPPSFGLLETARCCLLFYATKTHKKTIGNYPSLKNWCSDLLGTLLVWQQLTTIREKLWFSRPVAHNCHWQSFMSQYDLTITYIHGETTLWRMPCLIFPLTCFPEECQPWCCHCSTLCWPLRRSSNLRHISQIPLTIFCKCVVTTSEGGNY